MKFVIYSSIMLLCFACSGAKQGATNDPTVLTSSNSKEVGTARVSWDGQTDLIRKLRYSKDALQFDMPVTLPEKLPESISLSLPQEYSLFDSADINHRELLAKTDSNGVMVIANLDSLFPRDGSRDATLHLQSKEGTNLNIGLRLPPKPMEFVWRKEESMKHDLKIGVIGFSVLAELSIRNPNESAVDMSVPTLNAMIEQKITHYTLSDSNTDCPFIVSNPSDSSIREMSRLYLIDKEAAFEPSLLLNGVKTIRFKTGQTKQFLLITSSKLAERLLVEGESFNDHPVSHQKTSGYRSQRLSHTGEPVDGICIFAQGDLRVGDWKERASISISPSSFNFDFRFGDLPPSDDPASVQREWYNNSIAIF